jgi:hypothetical protein
MDQDGALLDFDWPRSAAFRGDLTKRTPGLRTEGVWKSHYELVVAAGSHLGHWPIHRSATLCEEPIDTPAIRFNLDENSIALIDYRHRWRW